MKRKAAVACFMMLSLNLPGRNETNIQYLPSETWFVVSVEFYLMALSVPQTAYLGD
jgi:hypothetical protein